MRGEGAPYRYGASYVELLDEKSPHEALTT